MIRGAAIARNDGRFGLAIPIWLILIEATTNALKGRSMHATASGYNGVYQSFCDEIHGIVRVPFRREISASAARIFGANAIGHGSG